VTVADGETLAERGARYAVIIAAQDRDCMTYTPDGVPVVVGLRRMARLARTTIRTIQAAIAGAPDLPPLVAVRYRGGPWRHGNGAWIATADDVLAWRRADDGPGGLAV
jgi:hypothetical protein